MSINASITCSNLEKSLSTCKKVSTHLNFRDKSVKTLQYASRVLLGYYGDTLNHDTKATLSNVVQNCSQGRKAFRLLKSINMLQSLVALYNNTIASNNNVDEPLQIGNDYESETHSKVQNCRKIAKYCETLELMCMVGYYACDNVLFLGRAKILSKNSYNAQFWESTTFSFWAVNDVIAIYRGVISLWTCRSEYDRIQRNIDDKKRRRGNDDDGDEGRLVSDNTSIEELQEYLRNLDQELRTVIFSLIKSCLDLGVSGGHCMHCYKDSALVRNIDRFTPFYKLFGHDAVNNGNVGLCGMITAVMTCWDIYSSTSTRNVK
jgi:hypothetical protein